METFYKLLAVLGAGIILWYLYTSVKRNPETFSKENFSKSFSTMGILALGLIGFIALLVFMLRAG
jgi:hypothetical protein